MDWLGELRGVCQRTCRAKQANHSHSQKFLQKNVDESLLESNIINYNSTNIQSTNWMCEWVDQFGFISSSTNWIGYLDWAHVRFTLRLRLRIIYAIYKYLIYNWFRVNRQHLLTIGVGCGRDCMIVHALNLHLFAKSDCRRSLFIFALFHDLVKWIRDVADYEVAEKIVTFHSLSLTLSM